MTTEKLQNKLVVCLIALLCCFLWGSAFPCIKVGYQLFQIASSDWASQILFAGMRFTLAAVLVILIGSLAAHKVLVPAAHAWKDVFVLSLLQTVSQYVLFYIGLAHTSGVKASILEASNVFISMVVASFLFHQEKLGAGKILGCLIGFAGVVFVNVGKGAGMDLSFTVQGEGFILISTFAAAFAAVLIKKFSQHENPVTLSGYQFLFGGVVMMIVGALCGGRISQVPVQGLFLLLYMAGISAVAYSLWGVLLKVNPVSEVAIYGFTNPVFGVILSGLLLGEGAEAFGIKSLVALLLVSAGIVLVNKSGKTPKTDFAI